MAWYLVKQRLTFTYYLGIMNDSSITKQIITSEIPLFTRHLEVSQEVYMSKLYSHFLFVHFSYMPGLLQSS
jgi:hypothetical protein